MFEWKQGRPEDRGIPAGALEELERQFQSRKIRVYGYMILSGETILAEKYYGNYHRDRLHRMYSVTKSFVAMAVGLLVKNGLVGLDDAICDYFPEKLPEGGAHPWCRELTIREMLTMRTCHGTTTYKDYPGDDWTESFFRVEPDHVPGTVFAYDTSSSLVLAALVEKLTGKKLLDYMRQEMLDELGFSREAYILEDPVGVSQGGSGMLCTLRDMALAAALCCGRGKLGGKQFLPRTFMEEALRSQVPTDLQPKLDEKMGYGYFVWMPREEGFTFYGLGGQLAVCFPKYGICYLTIADTLGAPDGVSALHDCFYQTVWPWVEKQGRQGEPALSGVPGRGTDLPGEKEDLAWREETDRLKSRIQGKRFTCYPNKMGWESVLFDWEQGLLEVKVSDAAEAFRFSFREGEWLEQKFLLTDMRCECRGYWKMGHFFFQCHITDEELGSLHLDFAWKDSRLGVRAVTSADRFQGGMDRYFKGFASAAQAEL